MDLQLFLQKGREINKVLRQEKLKCNTKKGHFDKLHNNSNSELQTLISFLDQVHTGRASLKVTSQIIQFCSGSMEDLLMLIHKPTQQFVNICATDVGFQSNIALSNLKFSNEGV